MVPSAWAGQAGEGAVEAADRRAGGGGDDDLGHDWVLPPSMLRRSLDRRRRLPTSRRAPAASASIQASSGRHSAASAPLPADHADMAGRGLVHHGRPAAPPPGPGPRPGGTMRSRAGWRGRPAAAAGRGSTASPAIRQAPRAGVLAPYQPPRHSRATGAASGTPSFSQSSSATKRRAAGGGRVEPGEGAVLARRCRRGRARRTAPGWHPPAACRSPASSGSSPGSRRRRRRGARGVLGRRSPRASPAAPRPRTRSGRRSAAARASSPPMQ